MLKTIVNDSYIYTIPWDKLGSIGSVHWTFSRQLDSLSKIEEYKNGFHLF